MNEAKSRAQEQRQNLPDEPTAHGMHNGMAPGGGWARDAIEPGEE